jgi:hypothetical protein
MLLFVLLDCDFYNVSKGILFFSFTQKLTFPNVLTFLFKSVRLYRPMQVLCIVFTLPPSSHAYVRFSHLSKFFPEIFEPTETKLGLNVTFVVLIFFFLIFVSYGNSR